MQIDCIRHIMSNKAPFACWSRSPQNILMLQRLLQHKKRQTTVPGAGGSSQGAIFLCPWFSFTTLRFFGDNVQLLAWKLCYLLSKQKLKWKMSLGTVLKMRGFHGLETSKKWLKHVKSSTRPALADSKFSLMALSLSLHLQACHGLMRVLPF